MIRQLFTISCACAVIILSGTSYAKDDWSDLRDSIFGQKGLTKIPDRDPVTFRNLATNKVSMVVADSEGRVSGWYDVPGGQSIKLVFPPGHFYLHARDEAGNLLRFSSATSRIPLTNNKFHLYMDKGGTYSTTINDKKLGTYSRQALVQLGFQEAEFFAMPTDRGVDFTMVAGKPQGAPNNLLKPPTLGQPAFEFRAADGTVSHVIRQPNGVWRVWEGSRHVDFQQMQDMNGNLRIAHLPSGTAIEIRGNSVFTQRNGASLTHVGAGNWTNR